MNKGVFNPKVGDWVEVRAVSEILATLDANGELERLPFMLEMIAYAGRRFKVTAVAHKTCDTVNRTGGRRVDRVVHLDDLRCNGDSHGSCQAACLLFWKTDWLKPIDELVAPSDRALTRTVGMSNSEMAGSLNTHASRLGPDGVIVYRCQATTLPHWSHRLYWWDMRQYWRDVRSGNVTWRHAIVTLSLAIVYNMRRLPVAYRASCWLYAKTHLLLKGTTDPHGRGTIPRGQSTPTCRLDLQVGELVHIRNVKDIYATVNEGNFNRGLQVDEEMTKYCGELHRVVRRVTQIIDERTGRMLHFKNPCIVLDGINCTGDYSAKRLMCPRRITAYWRELWLERVDEVVGPR